MQLKFISAVLSGHAPAVQSALTYLSFLAVFPTCNWSTFRTCKSSFLSFRLWNTLSSGGEFCSGYPPSGHPIGYSIVIGFPPVVPSTVSDPFRIDLHSARESFDTSRLFLQPILDLLFCRRLCVLEPTPSFLYVRPLLNFISRYITVDGCCAGWASTTLTDSQKRGH